MRLVHELGRIRLVLRVTAPTPGPEVFLPWVDDPGVKQYWTGTHRLVAPEDTLSRVAPFLPAVGVTRIANVTGLDVIGLPVVMVCRPNSRGLSVAQGKGISLPAAQASGVMEAIEGYHAEHAANPLRYETYDALRQNEAVAAVRLLPRPSPAPFKSNEPLLWVEGFDLLQHRAVWVPYELVHTNFVLPLPPGSGAFCLNSNGLASGNHPWEAVSHAICEVVERHATAHWRRSSPTVRDSTRLDLESVDDASCRYVLDLLDRAGVSVAVWDTTPSFFKIASFCCWIVDRRDDPSRRLGAFSGAGCHPARSVALLRALTEAVQSRLTQIAGSRDDLARADYSRARSPVVLRHVRTEVHRLTAPTRLFQQVPSSTCNTFEDDVAWELDQLVAGGICSVAVVNLTKPAFGIPVVRTIIPGLQGFPTRGLGTESLAEPTT